MSTLVVHEWWADYGGSEKVASLIADAVSADDFICLKYVGKNNPHPRESWIRHMPFSNNKFLLAAVSPIAYRTLTSKSFDLVISSSHNFAHTTRILRNSATTYMSYIHTPSRSIWNPDIDKRGNAYLGKNLLEIAKRIDVKFGNHVKAYACNSNEVKNRIEKHWSKNAEVIHPYVRDDVGCLVKPIGINLPNRYILSAGRFVDYKNHAFSIQLAAKIGVPIVIMGSGPDESVLRQLAINSGIHVQFIISPNDDIWNYVLSKAEVLLFPVFEDFGLVPIEAMKYGVPVLALNKGGAIDYVQNYINGQLVDGLNIDSWVSAFKSVTYSKSVIKNSVNNFSVLNFQRSIREWVANNSRQTD